MKPDNSFKIIHMASMARSGETLVQRCLSRSPSIVNVHNLNGTDTPKDTNLFNFLKKHEELSISKSNPLVIHKDSSADFLLLKQGVWNHRFEFNGFILSRNPLSIYSSMKQYEGKWNQMECRIKKWMVDIDKTSIKKIDNLSPVDQFILLYNKRMGFLSKMDKLIIKYENFVRNPKKECEKICERFNIEYSDFMINSHLFFKDNMIGHGKINLSKEINTNSLYKYKEFLSQEETEKITNECFFTANKLGHKL